MSMGAIPLCSLVFCLSESLWVLSHRTIWCSDKVMKSMSIIVPSYGVVFYLSHQVHSCAPIMQFGVLRVHPT